jgi:hypothetical protein
MPVESGLGGGEGEEGEVSSFFSSAESEKDVEGS